MFSETNLDTCQWLRNFIASLSPRGLGFEHGPPCDVCGGYSGALACLSKSISVFPCQYHSTNAPCAFLSQSNTYQDTSRHAGEAWEPSKKLKSLPRECQSPNR